MAATTDSHVYVGGAKSKPGTMGGVFRQRVGDDRWEPLAKGLPEAVNVHAITVHPTQPDVVYLGTNRGVFKSADRGERWERAEMDTGVEIWSVFVHPSDPRRLYAGASPVGVFRSDDGGDTWRRMPGVHHPERVRMEFACRVMRIAADPASPEHLYAALEVGGAMRSFDGGEHWEDVSKSLLDLAELPHLKSRIGSDTDVEGMMDGHALCVSAAAPDRVILAVRMGLFQSDDRGQTWRDMEVGRFSPLTYGRDVRVSPQDPRTLYACLSPASRSQDGSLYRSRDLGQTWSRLDHGVKAEATMMAVALDDRDPAKVFCASRCGQVFGTVDGGQTWRETRLSSAVQDVYAIACG